MSNPRLLIRNLADTAIITANPAMSTTLPVTNLQTQERKKTARTTGVASQDIKLTWGAVAQTINMMALARHNLTTAATLRWRLYSDAAWVTNIYDSAALTAFNPSGHSAADIFTDADFRMLKNSAQYHASFANVQSAILTIADAANPDGYFDASRLFVGSYWEFAYQFPYGSDPIMPADMSVQGRADSGSLITDKREKYMKQSLAHEQFDYAADYNQLLAAARYLGLDKDFWFLMFPGGGTFEEVYRQGQYKFAAVPESSRHIYGLVKAPINIEMA